MKPYVDINDAADDDHVCKHNVNHEVCMRIYSIPRLQINIFRL